MKPDVLDEVVRDLARRIFRACARGEITLAELLALYRELGVDRVPLHHVLV
jgi:hypothetical protein